ncbi:hypothetical protein V8C35DRAFT_298343 [Trichoderma chlorosporum]
MSSFHLFPLLPAEIRSEIYMLATPPRVVHLRQQVESFEDFEKRLLQLTIAERNVRPDVDYIAFSDLLRQASFFLRHGRRTVFKQTKLEAYGFTSNKKAQFSWEFESLVPLDVVMNIPTLAFPLYRRATFSSKAAIPPLLHACSESRSYLISCGYQLAFPSTAEDPRTWFNFKQDTLLLEDDFDCADANPYGVIETEIARIPYTFHHFRPQDIVRLQRLALAISTHHARVFLAHKICPVLKELTLVEWSASDSEQALRQSIIDSIFLSPTPTISQISHKGEHFCMLPIEEADALWTTMELDVFGGREYWLHDNRDATSLRQHKLAHGFDSLFIKDRLCKIKEEYLQTKEEIEHYNKEYYKPFRRWSPKTEEYPPWSMNEIRFAHICTPYTAERIMESRSKFMEQFRTLVQEVAQGEDKDILSWTEQHRLPHPFVLQKNNWPEVEESKHSIELEWWVKNGLPAISNST